MIIRKTISIELRSHWAYARSAGSRAAMHVEAWPGGTALRVLLRGPRIGERQQKSFWKKKRPLTISAVAAFSDFRTADGFPVCGTVTITQHK